MALLVWLLACKTDPILGDNCAKVFCGAGQICLRTEDDAPEDTADTAVEDPFGNLPVCADAPAACGPVVTCACLPDCVECEKSGGLVHCTVEAE